MRSTGRYDVFVFFVPLDLARGGSPARSRPLAGVPCVNVSLDLFGCVGVLFSFLTSLRYGHSVNGYMH